MLPGQGEFTAGGCPGSNFTGAVAYLPTGFIFLSGVTRQS